MVTMEPAAPRLPRKPFKPGGPLFPAVPVAPGSPYMIHSVRNKDFNLGNFLLICDTDNCPSVNLIKGYL